MFSSQLYRMLQSSDEPRQCPMCYDGGETQMGVTKDGKSVLEVCGRYAYGIEADSQVQDSGKGVCVLFRVFELLVLIYLMLCQYY